MSLNQDIVGANYGITGQATIATSSTLLLAATALGNRRGVTFVNMDLTNPVYITYTNPATVANGFPLLPGQSLTIRTILPTYAISTGGSVKVGYITEDDI